MMMRKRKLQWVLLHKIENNKSIYIYEPLRNKQIDRYEKHGWEVKPND